MPSNETQPPLPPELKKAKVLSGLLKWLNALRAVVMANRPVAGAGILIDRSSDRLVIKLAGGSAPNSLSEYELFAVSVLKVGGSAGDPVNYCSFTYDVTDIVTADPLGSALSPMMSRARSMKAECEEGSFGSAYYIDDTLYLWDVDEKIAKPPGLFAVIVVQDGGDAGSATEYCSFTYTVRDLEGNVLDTAMIPMCSRARILKAACNEAQVGSALYDETSSLMLWDVDETIQQTNCP